MADTLMPFPGTRLLHRDFETHHRPTAEQVMTVGVVITRAGTGGGVFDPNTGSTSGPARTDVAATTARVQATAAADRLATAGEQTVTLRGYRVSVPITVVGVRVDDRVEVTSVHAGADPALLGTLLVVRDVTVGSITWERDLICEEDLG